jgi:hypothetical protein
MRRGEGPLFFESLYDKAIDADYNFLHGQIDYLQKERTEYRKLVRLTKRIKLEAQYEYCEIMGLNDAEWEALTPEVKHRIFNRYLLHENEFREKYRESITQQIGWLQDAIEKLDDV